SLIIGLFVHGNGYVLLACLLAVIGTGSAWPWLSLRGIRAEITFDRMRGREGEPVTAILRVRDYLPLGAWGGCRGGRSGRIASAGSRGRLASGRSHLGLHA